MGVLCTDRGASPCSGGALVAVMEATDLGSGDDPAPEGGSTTRGCGLLWSSAWCGRTGVVVGEIGAQDAAAAGAPPSLVAMRSAALRSEGRGRERLLRPPRPDFHAHRAKQADRRLVVRHRLGARSPLTVQSGEADVAMRFQRSHRERLRERQSLPGRHPRPRPGPRRFRVPRRPREPGGHSPRGPVPHVLGTGPPRAGPRRARRRSGPPPGEPR